MLKNAGSTRAALTIAGDGDLHAVALLDGKDLQSSTAVTILVATRADTIALSQALSGSGAVDTNTAAATVYRINATSGNPKASGRSQAYPTDCGDPCCITGKNSTGTITRRDGNVEVAPVAGVVVEPYSLVAVRVALKRGDD